jgi:signal transduction histidine kinase
MPAAQGTVASKSFLRAPGVRLALLSLAAVGLISLFDGLTLGGVVVGILLTIPIIAVSSTDDARFVWIVFGAAWIGFVLAAILGTKPVADTDIALPNRIFVMLTLGASAWVALLLQRRRLDAQRARDSAIDTRETNRLLMALIAHDLRSPLATALHTFEYLEHTGAHAGEDEVAREIRGRLRRSLRVIDAFLAMGGSEEERARAEHTDSLYITSTQLATILAEEVRAFEAEASARSKTLALDLTGLLPGSFLTNVLILRQAMAILIDNAVRYAVPGSIRVHVSMNPTQISLTVEDSGPGLSSQRPNGHGAGLGLQLCGALVRRSHGELHVLRDRPDGTSFVLSLPLRVATDGL